MKNRNAVLLGKLGGEARARKLTDSELREIASQGGHARAKKLSKARRHAIAVEAVRVRELKRAQQQKRKKR